MSGWHPPAVCMYACVYVYVGVCASVRPISSTYQMLKNFEGNGSSVRVTESGRNFLVYF